MEKTKIEKTLEKSDLISDEEHESRGKIKRLLQSLLIESFGAEDLEDYKKEASEYLDKINEKEYLYKLIHMVNNVRHRRGFQTSTWQGNALHDIMNDVVRRADEIDVKSKNSTYN